MYRELTTELKRIIDELESISCDFQESKEYSEGNPIDEEITIRISEVRFEICEIIYLCK